jgi:hypothetical protein
MSTDISRVYNTIGKSSAVYVLTKAGTSALKEENSPRLLLPPEAAVQMEAQPAMKWPTPTSCVHTPTKTAPTQRTFVALAPPIVVPTQPSILLMLIPPSPLTELTLQEVKCASTLLTLHVVHQPSQLSSILM